MMIEAFFFWRNGWSKLQCFINWDKLLDMLKLFKLAFGECYCMFLLEEDGSLNVFLATTTQIFMVIQPEKLQQYMWGFIPLSLYKCISIYFCVKHYWKSRSSLVCKVLFSRSGFTWEVYRFICLKLESSLLLYILIASLHVA